MNAKPHSPLVEAFLQRIRSDIGKQLRDDLEEWAQKNLITGTGTNEPMPGGLFGQKVLGYPVVLPKPSEVPLAPSVPPVSFDPLIQAELEIVPEGDRLYLRAKKTT